MTAPRWARHVRSRLEPAVKDAEQWIRASAFGSVDGLVTNALFIFGTSLTGSTPHDIAQAGLRGLVAAPIAQSLGENLSVGDENEAKLRKAARQAGTGGTPPRLNSPTTAAVAAWVAATAGAAAPVVPYLAGASSPLWALGVGAAGLATAGVASTKVTGRRWWQGAKRYLSVGAIAGTVSYLADNAGTVARHPLLTATAAVSVASAAVVRARWRRRRAGRAERAAAAPRPDRAERRRTPTTRLRGDARGEASRRGHRLDPGGTGAKPAREGRDGHGPR